MAEPVPDYRPYWRAYARRRARIFLFYWGGFGAVVLLSILWPHLGLLFWAMYIIGYVCVTGAGGDFLCPRCRQPFFRSDSGVLTPWASRCLHCGLPKWADHDADTR